MLNSQFYVSSVIPKCYVKRIEIDVNPFSIDYTRNILIDLFFAGSKERIDLLGETKFLKYYIFLFKTTDTEFNDSTFPKELFNTFHPKYVNPPNISDQNPTNTFNFDLKYIDVYDNLTTLNSNGTYNNKFPINTELNENRVNKDLYGYPLRVNFFLEKDIKKAFLLCVPLLEDRDPSTILPVEQTSVQQNLSRLLSDYFTLTGQVLGPLTGEFINTNPVRDLTQTLQGETLSITDREQPKIISLFTDKNDIWAGTYNITKNQNQLTELRSDPVIYEGEANPPSNTIMPYLKADPQLPQYNLKKFVHQYYKKVLDIEYLRSLTNQLKGNISFSLEQSFNKEYQNASSINLFTQQQSQIPPVSLDMSDIYSTRAIDNTIRSLVTVDKINMLRDKSYFPGLIDKVARPFLDRILENTTPKRITIKRIPQPGLPASQANIPPETVMDLSFVTGEKIDRKQYKVRSISNDPNTEFVVSEIMEEKQDRFSILHITDDVNLPIFSLNKVGFIYEIDVEYYDGTIYVFKDFINSLDAAYSKLNSIRSIISNKNLVQGNGEYDIDKINKRTYKQMLSLISDISKEKLKLTNSRKSVDFINNIILLILSEISNVFIYLITDTVTSDQYFGKLFELLSVYTGNLTTFDKALDMIKGIKTHVSNKIKDLTTIVTSLPSPSSVVQSSIYYSLDYSNWGLRTVKRGPNINLFNPGGTILYDYLGSFNKVDISQPGIPRVHPLNLPRSIDEYYLNVPLENIFIEGQFYNVNESSRVVLENLVNIQSSRAGRNALERASSGLSVRPILEANQQATGVSYSGFTAEQTDDLISEVSSTRSTDSIGYDTYLNLLAISRNVVDDSQSDSMSLESIEDFFRSSENGTIKIYTEYQFGSKKECFFSPQEEILNPSTNLANLISEPGRNSSICRLDGQTDYQGTKVVVLNRYFILTSDAKNIGFLNLSGIGANRFIVLNPYQENTDLFESYSTTNYVPEIGSDYKFDPIDYHAATSLLSTQPYRVIEFGTNFSPRPTETQTRNIGTLSRRILSGEQIPTTPQIRFGGYL